MQWTIEQLQRFSTSIPDKLNWKRARFTHELLATACVSLSSPDSATSRVHGAHAVEIARQFGNFGDRARAHHHWAEILAQLGDIDESIDQQRVATTFARLAARPLDEADWELGLANLLSAKATELPDDRESFIELAIAACSAARRALNHLPRVNPRAHLLVARSWWSTAKLLYEHDDKQSAILAAQRAASEFELVGALGEVQHILTWIEQAQRSS